jgi:hypothetical protein
MSETYQMACMDCREFIWIGQRDYIYRQKRYLDAVEKFLFVHTQHELQFLSLNKLSTYTDWIEIVVPEEDGNYEPGDLDEDHIRFDEWLKKKEAGISIR